MAKQATKPNAAALKAAFVNTAKKNEAKWKDGRKAKPGEGGFKVPEIDNGRYLVKVTGTYEVGARGSLKGHAIVHLLASVNGGDFDGIVVDGMHDLSTSDEWRAEQLARDLKSLLPDRADEISVAEVGDLPGFIEEINANPVEIYATFTNGTSAKGTAYINTRFEDQGAEDPDAETTEDASDEPEDAEPEDATDEPEDATDWEPEKGETVSFEFRKKKLKGKIISVNRGESTVRVQVEKKVYPVKWADLTLEESA